MSTFSPTPQPTTAADGLGAAPRAGHEAVGRTARSDGGQETPAELRAEALHHATARTLDELPEPSLRLLAAMAVVDQETPLPILAVIADVADPSAALDDLIEAGFVTWFPRGLAQPVGISSPSLRGVVYWNLPASLRRAMHLASAEQVSGVHGLQHALLGAAGAIPDLPRGWRTRRRAITRPGTRNVPEPSSCGPPTSRWTGTSRNEGCSSLLYGAS